MLVEANDEPMKSITLKLRFKPNCHFKLSFNEGEGEPNITDYHRGRWESERAKNLRCVLFYINIRICKGSLNCNGFNNR